MHPQALLVLTFGKWSKIILMKNLFLVIYIVLLIIPGFTILKDAQLDVIFANPPDVVYLFLRLAALYGVTLMFVQLILGSYMQKFISIYGGNILRWHIRQGLITYGIVLAHPLLYTVYGAQITQIFDPIRTLWPNLSDVNEYYISFGRLGLYLLTIGIFFAYFRSHKLILKHWRKFHIVNYVAFAFILFHSWSIGSDTRTAPFIFLYPIFVGGLVAAIFYRRIYRAFRDYRRPIPARTASS